MAKEEYSIDMSQYPGLQQLLFDLYKGNITIKDIQLLVSSNYPDATELQTVEIEVFLKIIQVLAMEYFERRDLLK